MKHLIIAVIGISFIAISACQQATVTKEMTYDDAYYAWDAGDYIEALTGFKQILESTETDCYLEDIALATGELYHVDELSVDGSAIGFSPDGEYAVYETRDGRATTTHIVNVQNGVESTADIEARNVVFSPIAGRIAYLSVQETDELIQARSAAAQQRANLAWLEAKNSRIAVRDLNTGNERLLDTGELVIVNLAYGADGSSFFFTAGFPGNTTSSDIYTVPESSGSPKKVTGGSGFKTNPVVSAGGNYLIYSNTNRNPVPQPPGAQPQAQTGRGRGQRGGGGFGAVSSFVVQDLSTGRVKSFEGSSYALAAGGSTVAFASRSPDGLAINVVALSGNMDAVEVFKTSERVNTVQISPNGRFVAFDMMTKDDFEVYVVNTENLEVKRLSNEIQHDRKPMFVTNDLLLSAKGEGRHQRTYLYNLSTGSSVKLFHNNSVRTIAPEYDWASSPDGSKLLIVAERDGDTISPERGVYLMDFNRKVTKSELLDRIEMNLASEIGLHERGEKMYKPIYDDVKSVTEQVSTSRIFSYEKSLHDFGSKNISRPGNAPAREYLFKMYESFGYEPELQWFEARGGIRTANVLATLRGTEHPDLIYVISSHFDSSPRGPGADDNTSGTVALLEAARVLRNHPMPATIIFASFTGEESGLLGSREFVRQAVANEMKLVGALNNDMVGWSENHRLDNTIRYSNPGIRDLQHSAAFLFTDLITYDALYYKSTDAAAYYEAYGDIVGGIGSYPVLGSPFYHQATDRLEQINHQLIAEVSKTTAASIMLLASSPSRLKDLKVDDRSGDSVEISWTPSLETGVDKYIVAYGPSDDPMKHTMNVSSPNAKLSGIEKGAVIAVKAVNSGGFEGWDWARITLDN